MRSLVLLDEQGVVVQQGLGLDLDRLRLAETLDPVVQGAPAATATLVGVLYLYRVPAMVR